MSTSTHPLKDANFSTSGNNGLESTKAVTLSRNDGKLSSSQRNSCYLAAGSLEANSCGCCCTYTVVGQKKAFEIQKYENFDDFSFSKYDIFRTVASMPMMFFANC